MSGIRPAKSQYEQIADVLRREIGTETHPPGSALPSEPELAERFDVSRPTVNRAIGILRAEGLVKVRRGAGTYVRSLPRTVRDARTRYAARDRGTGAAQVETRDSGLRPRTDYGEIGRVRAPAEIAVGLGIEAGADVLVRRRVLYANDEPAQIADSYFPWELVAGSALVNEDTGKGGSYSRLAELGFPIVRFTEDVNVRHPTDAERQVLDLEATQSVFEIIHVAWAAGDRPVEVAVHVMPGHLWTLRYGWDDER